MPTQSGIEAQLHELQSWHGVISKVYFRIHHHTLQYQLQGQQWYVQNVFIPGQLYHVGLPCCSLGTGFIKHLNIEPLMRPMQPFCKWFRFSIGTHNIHCSFQNVKLSNLKPLSHPEPFTCFGVRHWLKLVNYFIIRAPSYARTSKCDIYAVGRLCTLHALSECKIRRFTTLSCSELHQQSDTCHPKHFCPIQFS